MCLAKVQLNAVAILQTGQNCRKAILFARFLKAAEITQNFQHVREKELSITDDFFFNKMQW